MLSEKQSDKALKPLTAQEFRKLFTLGAEHESAIKAEIRQRQAAEASQIVRLPADEQYPHTF